MKKIISALITTILVLSPVAAFEWGGLLTETFKVNSVEPKSIDDINFKQGNGISLWANIPIKNDSSWYLATQGSYRYTYSFNGFLKNGYLTNIVDLDLLKVNGNLKINDMGISMSLGRYIVMDSTTKIFAQNTDGVSVKLNNNFFNLGLYAGYTGLINGNTVATIDVNGEVESNQGDWYTNAHPYVPFLVSLDYPSLFLNQSLGVQLSGFIDLGKDKYNRFYATANLKGPIYGPVYYNFVSAFGFDDFKSVMNYSAISFMAFLWNSTVKLNCEYASGDQLIFKSFKGFNSSNAYNASWAPEYSGLLLPSLDYIFSRREICIEVNGKFVMLYPKDTLIIKGVTGTLKTITNIYSDLAFEVGLNLYYDLETMGRSNYYTANVGLSLSF